LLNSQHLDKQHSACELRTKNFLSQLMCGTFWQRQRCTKRDFYTTPPHPQKNGPEMSSKSRIKISRMYLLTYGIAAIGTWRAHQTKSNNKHCQKPNKKFPNANPNIWTNNIRRMKCAPKFWFSANMWHFYLNFFSFFSYSVLLHTFSHFLIHSPTFSYFLTLYHTFSYFLILSHTFSYYVTLFHTFSNFSYFLILTSFLTILCNLSIFNSFSNIPSQTFSYLLPFSAFLTLSQTFLALSTLFQV